MKPSNWIIYILSLLMAGCAAYKELQPEPKISFIEDGYIQLQDDDEDFELSEGKKYFIKFPQPQYENTYLVLTLSEKSALQSFLTRAFDDGEGTIIKMTDESESPEKAARIAAVYGIIGFVDVPIVYLSIRLWRTLHPEHVMIIGGKSSGLDPKMSLVLILSLVAFSLLFLNLLFIRVQIEKMNRTIDQIKRYL